MQSDQGVVYGKQFRVGRKAGELIVTDDRGECASFQSGVDKVMAIQSLALDGKEKLSRRDGARIDLVSLRDFVTAVVAGRGEEFGNF